MAKTETQSQYKQQFMARTKQARLSREFTQQQVALALDIPQDQYKQYEKRGLLPHHLIEKFCNFCLVNEKWLITGRGRMVVQAEAPPKPARKPVPRARPKRAA